MPLRFSLPSRLLLKLEIQILLTRWFQYRTLFMGCMPTP